MLLLWWLLSVFSLFSRRLIFIKEPVSRLCVAYEHKVYLVFFWFVELHTVQAALQTVRCIRRVAEMAFRCGVKGTVELLACKARRRQSAVREDQKTLKQTRSGPSGDHRKCDRCGQRSDNCKRSGCKPYTLRLTKRKVQSAGATMVKLGQLQPPRRYASDCEDVVLISRWAMRIRRTIGMHRAMLGICIGSHFGNNMRTFAFVAPVLQKDWQMHACLSSIVFWVNYQHKFKTFNFEFLDLKFGVSFFHFMD